MASETTEREGTDAMLLAAILPNHPVRRQLGAAILAMCSLLAAAPAQAAGSLNLIGWCDHTDPALLAPFEKANNVTVNIKTIESTGMAFAILDQSKPGDWDLFAIDGIDVRKMIDKGLAAPIDDVALPLADLAPETMLERYTMRDGKRYAITEKYGTNSFSFNSAKIDPAALTKLAAMWDPKFKGRIAITDYYMPVIGMAAVALGKRTDQLIEADMPAIRELVLKVRANAKSVADVAAGTTLLATGDIDLLVGGGEWVSAGLAKENPAIDFAIPADGALVWTQAIGMFKDSPNQELAKKFIAYVMSAEAQSKLATSSCFWGVPTNRKAQLDDQARRLLHFDRQAEYLKRLQFYPVPDESLDKKMQDLWTEVLQSKP
jgi:spermidine/putrescine transport system substrate-binding protein